MYIEALTNLEMCGALDPGGPTVWEYLRMCPSLSWAVEQQLCLALMLNAVDDSLYDMQRSSC